MEELLNGDNFHSLAELENIDNLNVSGIYAIKLKLGLTIPEPFQAELLERNTSLIYIGKGQDICERLYQECRGKSHGTFFRSIGAILDCMPPEGSLVNKKNKNNYNFSKQDKEKIVSWINKNLEFSFIEIHEEIKEKERCLIIEYESLLNSQHNPQKSKELAKLRKKCRERATSNCE